MNLKINSFLDLLTSFPPRRDVKIQVNDCFIEHYSHEVSFVCGLIIGSLAREYCSDASVGQIHVSKLINA